MASAADDRLAAVLSALRLEALAPALESAGLGTLAALEVPLLASRPAFLALLKASGVGSLPQRQGLANGLAKRRREGDVPVWVRPGDALLWLSPWNWLVPPGSTVAISAAAGAYLRVRWRVSDGGASAAPSLAIEAPANEPQPMVLTATYRGYPPSRIRVRAGADGLVPLPAPPQPSPIASAEDASSGSRGSGAGEAGVHELTVQIESVVQSSDRWGHAAAASQPRLPTGALRLRGVVLPSDAIPIGEPQLTRSVAHGGLWEPSLAPSDSTAPACYFSPLRLLAFGDSITEGVMARVRDASDPEIGDLATTSAGGSWASVLARRMGAQCSIVSFGRQGWTVSANGGAPCFVEAWREIWAGKPRFAAVRGSEGARTAAGAVHPPPGGAIAGANPFPSAALPVALSASSLRAPTAPASVSEHGLAIAKNSPAAVCATEAPSLILVNIGTNDALSGASDASVSAAVRSWCWEARAVLGPMPVVVLVVPFGGFCEAAIHRGFEEYQGAGAAHTGLEEGQAVGARGQGGGGEGGSGRSGGEVVGGFRQCRDPRTLLIALGHEAGEGLRGPAPKGPSSIDGVHPNLDTHRRLAAAVHHALRGALGPLMPLPPVSVGGGGTDPGSAGQALDGSAGQAPDVAVVRVHLFGDSNVNTCLDIGRSAEEEIQEGQEAEMPAGGDRRRAAGGVATAPSGPAAAPAAARAVHSGLVYSGPDDFSPACTQTDGSGRDGSSPGYFCLAHALVAGSGMGLSNPHSVSGYRAALLSGLLRVRRGDVAVLKFGQVDTDFVFYLKMVDKPGIRFEQHCAEAVRKYFVFVDEVLAMVEGGERGGGCEGTSGSAPALPTLRLRRRDLYLATPFPAAVADSHLRGALCSLPLMSLAMRKQFEVKLSRLSRLPCLADRIAHGRAYCAALAAGAEARGLILIDCFSCLICPDGAPRVPCLGSNHHLPPAAAPFVAAAFDRHFHRVYSRTIGGTGGAQETEEAGEEAGEGAGNVAGEEAGEGAGNVAGEGAGNVAGEGAGEGAGNVAGEEAGEGAGNVAGEEAGSAAGRAGRGERRPGGPCSNGVAEDGAAAVAGSVCATDGGHPVPGDAPASGARAAAAAGPPAQPSAAIPLPGGQLSPEAAEWILACSAFGGGAPPRTRGHAIASWRQLAALLGSPSALSREFEDGPRNGQWMVRLWRHRLPAASDLASTRHCGVIPYSCPAHVSVAQPAGGGYGPAVAAPAESPVVPSVLVHVRGRFNECRPLRPYAWAVESDIPGAAELLQRALDATVTVTAAVAVQVTGEADAGTAEALARLREQVGVEVPPRVMNLTVPQLMRTPVASALLAAARQQVADG